MAYAKRYLSDPRDLRALAHPVRLAIMEQLTVHGALTATELADRVAESPSNCSWHLRKLAEHGFVEPAEGGVGRQRPWRPTNMGLTYNRYGDSAEMAQAGDALSRMFMEREVDRLYAGRDRLRADTEDWQRAAQVTQSGAWLTAAELRELNEAVQALLLEKLERIDEPDKRPPGSRFCALMAWGVPTYDITEPTPSTETGAGGDEPE